MSSNANAGGGGPPASQQQQQQQQQPENLCKDCGVIFDSSKSLDVHLHYHKENLMNKWGHRSTPPPASPSPGGAPAPPEDNNNRVKKARAAPADSSDPGYPHQFFHQDFQENGGGSAFQRISRGGYRFQPYQQQQPPQQQQQQQQQQQAQCDKCGYVCDAAHLVEHIHHAHPPTPTAFFFGGEPSPVIKEEQAEILDLDSHKVHHVYTPDGANPEEAQPQSWHHHQLTPHHFADLEPPPPHQPSPLDDIKREDDSQNLQFFYHRQTQEQKRYGLEENGGDSSPDFGGVSTTSLSSPRPQDSVHSFYELTQPPRPPHHHQEQVMQLSSSQMAHNKLPPVQKAAASGGWKSNEPRRPKTYNCSACNKWFTSSGHLKRHYNTTLHKNAVKQSGVLDPATLPISAHHHPPKEPPGPPPPAPAPPHPHPPPPSHFADELQKDPFGPPPPHPQFIHHPQHHLHDLHEFQQQPQPQEFQQYAQYPNALPPHVSSFGNEAAVPDGDDDESFFDAEEPPPQAQTLPSFAHQFGGSQVGVLVPAAASFVPEFGVHDVGGLFAEYHRRQRRREEEEAVSVAVVDETTPSSTTAGADELIVSSSTGPPQTARTGTPHEQEPGGGGLPPGAGAEEPPPAPVHRCLDCDKTFNKACYLTQHNKSFHSGDKPYKCSRCGKRFTQEYLHLEHLSKHAGDKPYKCEMCPKQFNHKTDLRRHMCLHSGDKPYACQVCGKGFIRKDHMLKHCETHKRKRTGGNQPQLRQQAQQRQQQQQQLHHQQQQQQFQGVPVSQAPLTSGTQVLLGPAPILMGAAGASSLLHQLQGSKRLDDVPPPLLVQ